MGPIVAHETLTHFAARSRDTPYHKWERDVKK